ncbi:hypothetical protein Pst134EA_003347 [Puccinia striiformis f. sp. tritici]|uniref:hypothetical protein n=1 Tax=Puccinia striiformis f. sp. tritici TaxID=168172 RepID=UPI00200851B1|nr:hypothetical protein Pst134EA_003347 [Puccinia striiformis f. sp. tritici]KAH9472740.1 hypothetical protein Pst134EA_003347 [Puccinia striiformis f. sp. tritici]KAI9620124.1 hypothetical protein KEM48_008327 [Puccinia striiformis f. sp. tritici PST-130]
MSSSTPQSSGLLELMHIIERLKTTKRAGWVRLGAQGPESIADHMYRMAMLAMLSEKDPDLDISKCVMLALVHDLAEAEVGDITPHDGISREEKYRRESIAIEKFTSELLPAQSISSQRLKSLWLEYEDGQTREAQFVKDLDRFELALQGVEYEKRDKLDSIQTFFETTVPLIKHPEVKGWANELMDERASIQGSKPFVKNFKDVRPQ